MHMTRTPEQLRAELLDLLKKHDWFFDRSDDYSAWSAGNAQRKQINYLARLVPDGQELLDAHWPKTK
jgi:hypothetical protein